MYWLQWKLKEQGGLQCNISNADAMKGLSINSFQSM